MLIFLYVFGFYFYSFSIGTIGLILGRVYGKYYYENIKQSILEENKYNEKKNHRFENCDFNNKNNTEDGETFTMKNKNATILKYRQEGRKINL